MPTQENQPGRRARQLLATEFATFAAHKEELLKTAPGRWALIHGEIVSGTFATQMRAVRAGYRRFSLEPFLVEPIVPVKPSETIYSASEQPSRPGSVSLRTSAVPIAA